MPRKESISLPDQVRSHARGAVQAPPDKPSSLLVPTGSALLNLALSDKSNGGFPVGKIVNIIGDSSSGKTFLALSMFAEAAHREQFAEYRFIYDDAEEANEFDMPRLFGESTASRIAAPNEGAFAHSHTVREWKCNVYRALRQEKPFIYILDSLDAISSEEEALRMVAENDAMEKGKKMPGTYGMEKAKQIGETLRVLNSSIVKSDSLLVVISQTRDNIDPMSFEPKKRAGGKALKFYCCHEMWLALKKKIKSRERVIGVNTAVKVSKNKLTGKQREVEFPIFYDYGVDDIGSCVDFMIKEGFWKGDAASFRAPEFHYKGSKQKFIKLCEERRGEGKLRKAVQRAWNEIEESIKLHRKAKYS